MRRFALIGLIALVIAGACATPASARPSKRTRVLAPDPGSPLTITATYVGGTQAQLLIGNGHPTFVVRAKTGTSTVEVYRGGRKDITVPAGSGTNIYIVTDSDGEVAQSEPMIVGLKLWVGDTVTGQIRNYDSQAGTSTATAAVETWSGLRNIAVRPSDDHLFAVDQYLNKVVEFDQDGAFVRRTTIPGASRLQDVAFDGSGRVFALDRASWAGRLTRLAADGTIEAVKTIPAPAGVPLPQYGNTTMHAVYYPPADTILVRFNSKALAGVDPATLQVRWYRYTLSPLLHPGWDIDPSSDRLYTESPMGWGSFTGVVAGTGYTTLPSTTGYSWQSGFDKLQMTDISVGGDGYVYTLQSDGGGTMGYPVRGPAVFAFDSAGAFVTSFTVAPGLRLAVVR